jgi:acyl carrier protein
VERLGVRPLGDVEAEPLLSLAVAGSHPHIVAVAADFQAFSAHIGHHPRAATVEILAGTIAGSGSAQSASAKAKGWLAAELSALASEDRQERLRDVLIDIVGSAIGDTGAVTDDVGFADIGLDSIMAIDLRARLAHALALDLPATIAIDYPSLPALTAFLLQLLPSGASNETEKPAGRAEADTQSDEGPTEQSLDDLLRAVKDDLANF